MDLSQIRIILVETSHPGNIGSTARAMKTMGLTQLVLVSPKLFPHPKALELAAGAQDILQQAKIVATVSESIKDCQIIFATTARQRGIALPELLPATAAEYIASQPRATPIGILFGREYAGLTNEELLYCNYQIQIPANPTYSSLNLSQAVQIMAYEIRMKCLQPQIKAINTKNTKENDKNERASQEEVERFYQHLIEVMVEIEFLKMTHPRKLVERIRRLFNRVGLEQMEVNILRGILTQMQKMLKRKNNEQ